MSTKEHFCYCLLLLLGKSGKGKKKTKKKVKKLSDATASRSARTTKTQRKSKKKASSQVKGTDQPVKSVENTTTSDNHSRTVDQKQREREAAKNIEILREALDRVKDVLRSAEKNLEHYEAVAKTKIANLRINNNKVDEEKAHGYLSENSKTVGQQDKGPSKNSSDAKGKVEKQRLPQHRRKSSSRRSRLGKKGESGHLQKPMGDPSGAKGARGGTTEEIFASLDARSLVPPESAAKGSRKRKGEEFMLRVNPRVTFDPTLENQGSDSGEGFSNKESRSSAISWNKVKHSRPSELKQFTSSARQCDTLEKSGKKKRRRKGDHLDIECSESHSDESALQVQSEKSMVHAQIDESTTHAQYQVSAVSEAVGENKKTVTTANSFVKTVEKTKTLNNIKTLRNKTLENSYVNGTKAPDVDSHVSENPGLSFDKPAVPDTGLDQRSEGDATKAAESSSTQREGTDTVAGGKMADGVVPLEENQNIVKESKEGIENGKVLDKKENDLVEKRLEVSNTETSENRAQNVRDHAHTEAGQLKTKDAKGDSSKDSSYKREVLRSDKEAGMAVKKSKGNVQRSDKPKSKTGARPLAGEVVGEKKEKKSAAEKVDSPSDEAPRELSEDECKDVQGSETLVQAHKHFSAWLSFESKNIE